MISSQQLWPRVLALINAHREDNSLIRSDNHSKPAETKSFEAFFWHFERQIFGYLWHMTNDEQLALDLSQETFIRAWQHFESIGEHRDNGAWLFRVASNLALTHLQRRVVQSAIPLDESLIGMSDPEMRITERAVVHEVLRQLSPKLRASLILHEIYGLTCEEIAQVLGMSQAAVKMALSRAREQFRTHYRHKGGRDV